MALKIFKKLNTKAMILGVSACAFGMSILLPTMSWFNSDTSSPISVDGNIHGSYFESGDGTAANPFEIARPIQLYYLSWLQELGYFNEAVLDPNTEEYVLKQQYHFYLSTDLDMNIENEDPYLLPPIGTITYPFIGSFDGRGHVITDLVVTNDVSTYTNDPKENSGGSPAYEILGLFGVLGPTDSTAVVSSSYIDQNGLIHKLQENGEDVKVSFSQADNYVTNTYLNNETIISSVDDASHALVGAVAGYSNASVSHIGIKGVTLTFSSGTLAVSSIGNTVGTSNLSDYAAFGFVMPEYKRTVDKIEKQVYQPKATANTYISNSAGSEWGGSVDFKSLNQRMNCTRNMSVTNNGNSTVQMDTCLPYPIRQTYVNGTLQAEYKTTNPGNFLNGQNIQDSYHYCDENAVGKTGEENTIGSYYYTWRDNARRIYLGGLSDITASSINVVTRITESDTTEECYYIKDGSNYAGITTGGVYQAYAQNNARTAVFHYDSAEQSLYTRKTDSDGLETIYFLNVQDGNYLIETTNNTTWTKNINNNTFTGTPKWKFRISSGSNYLRINGTSTPSNTTTTTGNNGTGTIWNISNYGTSNLESGIYATYQGRTYYLNYSGNSNSDTTVAGLRLYRAQYKSWKRSSQSGTTDVSFRNDINYLRYNNGWTTDPTTSRTFTLTQDTSTKTGSFETVNANAFTYTITNERGGQPGYIPLTAVGDGNVNNYTTNNPSISNLYASDINTGYIVGGFYDSSNGGKPFLAGTYFGDARISQYELSRINDSFSNNTYSNIYTINDDAFNGTGEDATEKNNPVSFTENSAQAQTYVKLKESLRNLKRILQNPLYSGNTAQISGIHFMDSSISTERTIRASSVKINGQYKTNYEMPEDSIDFTLKENGYINFLAGNYQSDNNSFFALHKIERDDYDNITSIKKIKFVFKDADDPLGDCIYLYDNEGSGYTWSDGENLTNRPMSKNAFTVGDKHYEFAFDTKWIAVNKKLVPNNGRRLYYFEIPVNVGEYALGSCEGGCGGYLVYLDISAASQTIQRKTVNEMFQVETLSGDIPYGTQYVGSIPNPVPVIDETTHEEDKTAIVRTGIQNIDDLDSYYGSISSSANGNYTIDRSGDTITVTGSNALTSNYIGDGLTLSGSTSGGRTSRIIRRITDYDYNTILGTCVKQTTTVEIVGSGSTAHNYATTKLEYNETDFNDPLTTIAIFSYDWIGDGPVFQYSYYLRLSSVQGTNSDVEVYFHNAYDDDFILTVKYVDSNFNFICVGQQAPVVSSDIPAVVDEDHPYPTREIIKTTDSLQSNEMDKWYNFNKQYGGYDSNESTVTPTVIAVFRYTREGSETIDENFVYSGYASLGEPNEYGETPTVITITNGSYTYEFILSGSSPTSSQQDPAVTIYYVADGVYIVRMGNGSEYILLVDESE